ncbi:Ribosomal RNA adenine methylase transferase [Penicillium brevicompactum]|uniref:Ribosomal RNA adenine methylase transferase n=1 Tax=Penicillium brevicompactum TaxID=5074 RepID=A0A9W9QGG8_PENBR|nr:Ribosomal RNA adenine methylase transferase [Penicillium brevicompactum]
MPAMTLRQSMDRFPAAKVLNKHFAGKYLRGVREIMDEELWDDVFQRLKPYLRQSGPLDILDLWPGSGVRSSKANELLNPRRHVLVRSDTKLDIVLKPLVKSNPSFKLMKEDIYGKKDWPEFLKTHFPEQDTTIQPKSGRIAKNNSLLVLANLPSNNSKKNHFTPGRWWIHFLEDSMRQAGLNAYGTVRVLATMPSSEVPAMLPRAAMERRRGGTLMEALNLHCFEVARSDVSDAHHTWRGWDTTQAHNMQVAERAAAQNIVTRPRRVPPPLEKSPDFDDRDIPYVARVASPTLAEWTKELAAADLTIASGAKGPELKKATKERATLKHKIVQEKIRVYTRHSLAEILLNIEGKLHQLSRAAADPKESIESLKVLDKEIESLQLSYKTSLSEIHYMKSKLHTHIIDDDRVLRASREMGHSQLCWERRPFEPLHLHEDEIWPRGDPTSVLYYEPNETPPILQKICHLPAEKQRQVIARFDTLISSLTQGAMSVEELKNLMIPHWSTNELVKAIPALATFANKRLKPDHGPLPLDDPAADPVSSYQENLDYDLSAVRMHIISAETFMDLALLYESVPDKLTIPAFCRLIGGTLTASQLVSEVAFRKKN